MSEAQTITSKAIATELDGWQVSCYAAGSQPWVEATGEQIVREEEHAEHFSGEQVQLESQPGSVFD